jgi:hypothetical protein
METINPPFKQCKTNLFCLLYFKINVCDSVICCNLKRHIYKNANWDTIKSEIKTPYDHIVQSQTHLNANQLWEIFKNKLNQLIDIVIPCVFLYQLTEASIFKCCNKVAAIL